MNIKSLAAIVAASLTLGLGSARAANSANDADVLLGFSAPTNAPAGAGVSYVVDLGSRASFQSNFNSQIQNIGADLATIYGSNWYFQNMVTWGLVSVFSEDNSIYGSTLTGSRGWATPGSNGNYSTQGPGASQIGRLYTSYTISLANHGDTGLLAGVQLPVGDVNGWDALVNDPSGAPFGYFSSSITTDVQSGIDIWIHDASSYGSDPTAGPTNLNLGAVPEPSTYALLGFGALMLLVAFRRQSKKA
jgi:hypothetical protein